MDPLSIVTSVCTLASNLQTWFGVRQEQTDVARNLALTVAQIHSITLQFQSREAAQKLTPAVIASFRALASTLLCTQDHLLQLNGESPLNGKGKNVFQQAVEFLRPDDVTKKLMSDEKQLTNQLVVILFGVTMQSFFSGPSQGVSVSSNTDNTEDLVLATVSDREIRSFWKDYVGAKLLCVPPNTFATSLKAWYKSGLSDSACEALLFRLDEYAVGGITPSSLENFTQGRSLRVVIDEFTKQKHIMPSNGKTQGAGPAVAKIVSSPSSNLRIPLLIWMDDDPKNNLQTVAFARSLGILVIELTSTALAKCWFEENEAFVRAHDTASQIRVISDNARYESENVPVGAGRQSFAQQGEDSVFLNWSAGEQILRYLRGRRQPMRTGYVLQYAQAGSTTNTTVVTRYCQALAQRRNDDAEWRRFNA
ncbi:hypothetical protein DACRYDRAFT_115514 [Dacryopinax primogenitus]|uniref:Uncharacterized protein n=1 Tax=Dacryopinax primogenitus (strain DJM 731) TaxID=1858805 RepID=M5FZ61_DACPD|nr:uncharacterized protein DACRYDRAFT_115514 [Dacryopinax primogenitus]EJU03331.1 hypothetical protein DACRYDRAFT_115514 [Dacryopinax primogenitus]